MLGGPLEKLLPVETIRERFSPLTAPKMTGLLVLSLIANMASVTGADPSPGRYRFIEHFSPDVYGAYPQNWAIAFGSDGVVYAGNRDGVLQFDGETWTLIPTEKQSTVRSLSVAADGTIFVGGQGELGFISATRNGVATYTSLLERLPPSVVDFQDVWTTYTNEVGTFFQTSHYLFLWDGNEFRYWASETGFHTLHGAQKKVFVREHLKGLLEYRHGRLELVKGGDEFATERIAAILPSSQYEMMVVTRSAGLFIMDESGPRRVRSPYQDELSAANIYGGCLAGNGNLILASLTHGILVVAPDGEILETMGPVHGMPDRVVNFVAWSPLGELWAALNSQGIVRIGYGSPTKLLSRSDGLEGTISDIKNIGGDIYVATASGLFVLDNESQVFDRIPGVPRSWSIESSVSGVLIGSDEGLFHLNRDRQIVERISDNQSFEVVRLDGHTGKYLVGTRSGILLLSEQPVWKLSQELGVGYEVRSIVQDVDKKIWIETRNNGVYLLKVDDLFGGRDSIAERSKLKPQKGRVSVVDIAGRKLFAYQGGNIHAYDDRTSEFYPSRLPSALKGESLSDTLLSSTTDTRFVSWVVLPSRVVQVWMEEDNYHFRSESVLRFPEITQARILVEESGVAWISRGDELYRYDPHVVKDYDVPYTALIRKVMDSRTDSVLFGGNFRTANGAIGTKQLLEDVPDFEYEFNNLKFQFAAPTFNSPGKTLYQYRLVGADDTWSEWSRTTTISYSGLSEGSYTFEVRAKNGFGYLSETGSYTFHLLPPWYRTWWAFTAYLFGCVTVVALSWKYVSMLKAQRAAKLQARELARERVINERLNDANEQLHRANLRLTEVNTLKDEFLATTSHELRTPITAILGYASILREEIPEDYHEFVDIIEKSGVRLMSTLNALLDLAELRAGTLQLSIETVDVNEILNSIVDAARVDAADRGLSISAATGDASAVVKTDKSALTKVINVLVGNAIKFTESGSVTVATSPGIDFVCISVSDTGVGIDESFLPVLFDEFRQESDGLSRSHSGNGLGLAIASKLVELLGGSIGVDSQKGVGTTFTITLPLTPVQIVGDSSSSRIEDESTGISGGHRNDRDPVDRHENAPPTNPMRHRTAKTADE